MNRYFHNPTNPEGEKQACPKNYTIDTQICPLKLV